MAERNWDRDLAEIVGRPVAADGPEEAQEGEDVDDTLDLRVEAPRAAPPEEWLELRIERIGASLLKLVDQRLVALTEDLRRQARGTSGTLQAHALDMEARLDALEDVIKALATRILAVDATLDAVRAQLHDVRSALFR